MAIPMPTAEVDVTAGLVRELLTAQHPDLARLPVEFLASGWDNAIFRLGEQLLARMPPVRGEPGTAGQVRLRTVF